MTERMVTFVRTLRDAGVRVSMAETMDAAEALRHTPVSERPVFKMSLQAALIKEHTDIPTFDALFERFFMVQLKDAEQPAGPETEAQEGEPENAQKADPDAEQDQTGETGYEEGEQQAQQEEGEGEEAAGEEEEGEIEEMLSRIQVGEDTAPTAPEPGRQPHRAKEENIDLYQELPPGQVEDLYEAVEELAASLVTRRSIRYHRARRGQVDIKRTLQKSFRTGNMPFHIILKRRKINKHELVVLCDISGSVWEVARFFLKLVQEMQIQFSRARSFLFVDRINEVTDTFDGRPFEEIIEQLKDDPSLNFFGLSDFGRAFYQFYAEHLKSLSRTTVLVILGDARTNWFDPMEWTLDEMKLRTHQVIWLNPEPMQYWDTDDSVMSKYAPHCHHVLECRNLDQLKRVGELILQT
ncbi:MAG: VWA domain-containing protein [candidate division Zixibacteria bacterium]|nr:VWA domain-containing protein [candidate division Zixibacteria bacterium]